MGGKRRGSGRDRDEVNRRVKRGCIGSGNWKGANCLLYDDKRHRGSILSLYCSVSRHQLLEEVICSVCTIDLTWEGSRIEGEGERGTEGVFRHWELRKEGELM